jgi:hypothetical protein
MDRCYANNHKGKKLWEELFTYFPLIQHGPHRKRHFQQFFVAAEKFLPSLCLAMKGGIDFTETFHSSDRGDTHIDTQIDGRD